MLLHEDTIERIRAAHGVDLFRADVDRIIADIRRDSEAFKARTADLDRYLVGRVDNHETRIQSIERRAE